MEETNRGRDNYQTVFRQGHYGRLLEHSKQANSHNLQGVQGGVAQIREFQTGFDKARDTQDQIISRFTPNELKAIRNQRE